MKLRYYTGKIILYLLIILVLFVMLLPYSWLVVTALKPGKQILTARPEWIPKPIMWSNFVAVFEDVPFLRYYGNSLYVAMVATFLSLLTCSLAGYGFSKYNFPGRDLIFICILGTMMIPFQVIMIPLYSLTLRFGLTNTLSALIIPAISSALGIFLMRQFMTSIPDSLIEAARMDGCSELRIYGQIVLPLSKPVLLTFGTLQFMMHWNNFLWPLIVIDSPRKLTIPLAISILTVQTHLVKYNILMAAVVIAAIPPLILFFLAQKYMGEAIVLTGLKE